MTQKLRVQGRLLQRCLDRCSFLGIFKKRPAVVTAGFNSKTRKVYLMKIRDMSLMAAGAAILVVGNMFVSTYTSKAEAQAAAPTAGSYPMVITQTGNGLASGIIAVNDQVHKRVTVVAFTYSNEPLILLSTNQSFSYEAP
jgi:hypothetical protein